MRIATTTLAVLVLTFGAFSLARGDDDAAGKTAPKAEDKALLELRAHVGALQMEVRYLREREALLTSYVVSNLERGVGLQTVVRRARAAGFEANRIPVDSRKILLGGLEAAAASLAKNLPVLTKDHKDQLKRILAFRKANGLPE